MSPSGHPTRRLAALALALAVLAGGGCGEGGALDTLLRIARREEERKAAARDVRADPILDFAFRGDSAAVAAALSGNTKQPRGPERSVRAPSPAPGPDSTRSCRGPSGIGLSRGDLPSLNSPSAPAPRA